MSDTEEPKTEKSLQDTKPKLSAKFWRIIINVILLLFLCSLIYNFLIPVRTSEIIVHVRPGETTAQIGKKLKQNKVIRSAFWFNVSARLTNSDRNLKAGRYVFGGHVNLIQTLSKIRSGKSTLLHLTIPEGFSLYQTVKLMEKCGIGTYDSLMAVATNPEIAKKLTGFEISTLEGFLYPETYVFDIDVSPEGIFSMMTAQFFRKLKEAGITIDDPKKFYQILILASIVEQEAVKEEEKPLIASVFLNRLKRGMKLESCPTVDYTLERKGISRQQLTYKDLEIDTPYNTYRIEGLPPNPICNPDIASIQAALHPASTSYLYFFADFKGNNIFSSSYAEHLQKQKLYGKRDKY